jgi:hypothetical protein
MQPKTIKIKNNGCGTAPGNLVYGLMIHIEFKKLKFALFSANFSFV